MWALCTPAPWPGVALVMLACACAAWSACVGVCKCVCVCFAHFLAHISPAAAPLLGRRPAFFLSLGRNNWVTCVEQQSGKILIKLQESPIVRRVVAPWSKRCAAADRGTGAAARWWWMNSGSVRVCSVQGGINRRRKKK